MKFYILACNKQARRLMKIWLNIVFLLLFQAAEGQNRYWLYLTEDGAGCRNNTAATVHKHDHRHIYAVLDSLSTEVHTESRWLHAFSVRTSLAPETLAALPFVREVAQMQALVPARLTTQDSTVLGLGLRQLEIDTLLAMGLNGAGVKIGVIDVGFAGADEEYSLRELIAQGGVMAYRDFVSPGTRPWDDHGTSYDDHGTDVWRLIAGHDTETYVREGLATGAGFYLARTDHGRNENRIEEDLWVQAIEWLDSLDVRLVHSSLGYALGFDDPAENHRPEEMDGKTTAIARAAQMAVEEKGMLLIISAGNEGQVEEWKILSTPADAPGVVAVGATGLNAFRRMGYSSIGPEFTDFVKPDVSVFSFNGTSLAAPLVTGLAALLWQYDSSLTNTALADLLRRSGHLYPYGNNYIGYGVPSGKRLLQLANGDEPALSQMFTTQERTIVITDLPHEGGPVVLFHKSNEKNVLKEEVRYAPEGQLTVTRIQGAGRCTVAHPQKVVEIVWED